MRTLKEINSQLAYYKNSEFRWVRELYIEFENYFDEDFRDILKYLNFKEEEMRDMLLFSLDNLFRVIAGGEYLVGDQNLNNNPVLGFQWLQHPARNPEKALNKSDSTKLFIALTLPWRTFIEKLLNGRISQLKLKENKVELDRARILAEKQKDIEAGQREQLEKILFDKQEEERKKIDNMVKFYIDACERNTTHKPKREMLVTESGLSIDLWRSRLNQEIFLKLLLDEIMKKYNQAKIPKKKKFWQKALVLISNRIDIIGDSYEFKRRGIDPNRSNQDTRYAVSLSDKVEAERINNEKGIISNNFEKVCDICGDYIDKGFRCDDCKDLFGDNK